MFSAGSTTGNVTWSVWQAHSLQPTRYHFHALMRVQAVSSCIHLVGSPRSSSHPNACGSKAPGAESRSWGPVLHIPGLQRVVKSRDGATERPDLGLVFFPGEALLLNPLLLLFHHVCASTQRSRSLKVPQRKLIISPLFTLLASTLLPDYGSVRALSYSPAGVFLHRINLLFSEPERCWQNNWFDSSVILSRSWYAGNQDFSLA